MDERKRDSIVDYLRRRMAEFDIEVDDVAAAIAADQLQQKSARYRSATGDIWTGEGELPQWLQLAVSAGQSVEHFAVNRTPEPAQPRRRAQSCAAACDERDRAVPHRRPRRPCRTV
ncbi:MULTISPECIES: H-NS family nucleoid-associated regulatory protein [Paraburkholderia]|jgi:DNA-binding protein H-NS|uniref:H-NS family nucleoid-associated regulatory protein n=1 Tax=Paraburkholderia TaxID=1822464 RepID=UPI0038BC781A